MQARSHGGRQGDDAPTGDPPMKLDYAALHRRAEAHRQSVWARAQRLCAEAGLCDAGHLHNAMVSLDRGTPWTGVDYAKAKASQQLFETQFEAMRTLTRLYYRKGPDAFEWPASA